MFDTRSVNGAEFIRQVRKLGRRRGVIVRFVATHGKGSHGRLHFGLRFTTVKDRKKEIGKGCWLPCFINWELTPVSSEEVASCVMPTL